MRTEKRTYRGPGRPAPACSWMAFGPARRAWTIGSESSSSVWYTTCGRAFADRWIGWHRSRRRRDRI